MNLEHDTAFSQEVSRSASNAASSEGCGSICSLLLRIDLFFEAVVLSSRDNDGLLSVGGGYGLLCYYPGGGSDNPGMPLAMVRQGADMKEKKSG